ncbi:claspin-like [Saccostrea cucullata]
MQKKGSFLGRNKETLAKIAELTKTTVNPTGPRNSRNFVFQVISPDKDTNKQNAVNGPTQGKARKAHLPKQHQPVAKKPRLEKSSSFPQNSIFNHM